MTEDRLVEEHRRESPAHDPHIFWEVVYPPLAVAVATYLLFTFFYDANVGKGMAGGFMLVALGWRLWRFDRNGRGVHIVETRRYVEPERTTREWAPVTVEHEGRNGRRWRVGRWRFTETETERLARALEGGVTRAALDSVLKDNGQRFFTNTSDRYQDYVADFRRLGFIDDDNMPTDTARAWFRERGHPLPPVDV